MSIYRITVKAFHSAGGAQYNTHHYEFPGYIPTQTEAEEAIQNLVDVYEEVLLAYVSNQVTYNEVEYRRVDVADLPTAVFVPDGWPITGTGTGNSLPSQVAANIRWVGDTAYPRSGRIYLQTSSTGACATNGQLSLATRTAMDTAALAMEQLEVTAQPDAQRVAVKYAGDPSAVVDWNLISARPASGSWGIQRRRRAGTGI